MELKGKQKDGQELLITGAIPEDKQAERIGALRGNSNSSKPKQTEEALLQENTEWESIFDSLTDAVTIHDKNFDIIRANASARQLLGLPFSGKFFNAKCFNCYHGTEEPPEGCPSCRSLVTERPSVSEFFEPNLNKYLEIRAIPRFDTNHQCVGLVHIVRDITERKRIEAEKDVLQAQLRQAQKMETIGQLAGGIAHDFNNLLTGILGNLVLLRSSLPAGDPRLENLTIAEGAAQQAATLTKGLLTFSRSAVVLPVALKVTDAITESLLLLKQTLPSSIAFVRDDEQPTWNVLLDQTQMTQILLNLGVNARDAMQGKGLLTIRTRNATIDKNYVASHAYARTGEFVQLCVTDTGPGLSSDAIQHLFEPFYTTKPVGLGTGLGLSIVYGAVKQAGGWITGASPAGAGATFEIYLPRCLEEPKTVLGLGSELAQGGGETILVVEDEPIVSKVAQALLSRSGYTVLTASDGATALNVLHEHTTEIGIILLDMTMPGMTTNEIVAAIRNVKPAVPILLNSGYTSNDVVKHMFEEGLVQGFLEKPYNIGVMIEKVQALLPRGGGEENTGNCIGEEKPLSLT